MKYNIIDTKTIAEAVKEARKRQGLSQDDLAGLTNVGRRFIGDLEKGKETAQIGKVIEILQGLGLSIDISSKWNDE